MMAKEYWLLRSKQMAQKPAVGIPAGQLLKHTAKTSMKLFSAKVECSWRGK